MFSFSLSLFLKSVLRTKLAFIPFCMGIYSVPNLWSFPVSGRDPCVVCSWQRGIELSPSTVERKKLSVGDAELWSSSTCVNKVYVSSSIGIYTANPAILGRIRGKSSNRRTRSSWGLSDGWCRPGLSSGTSSSATTGYSNLCGNSQAGFLSPSITI